MSDIGDNRPPSNIKFTEETASALGEWLKEHPVVETEDDARAGKLLVDRARLCLQELEDERKDRVRPLQQQVKDIDDEYRSPRSILDKVLAELKGRLNVWLEKEEAKRREEHEKLLREREELRKAALEAEAREREAIADASVGAESDIAATTREADTAFGAFQKKEREIARSEREIIPKITGPFGRALSSRSKKTPIVVDPIKALNEMGWSERLLEALVSDARLYERKTGHYPEGIVVQEERMI